MSAKKVLFVGARLMSGIAAKTGNPYEMITMEYLVDANARLGSLQKEHEAIGKEVKSKSLTRAAFEQCKTLKPLSWVEVEIDIDPENEDRTMFANVKQSTQPLNEVKDKKVSNG
jgi:hypothetical protein